MKKRWIILLIAVLIITCILPAASAADGTCFIGINDSVPLYLSGEQAPFYQAGELMVPYTVFNANPGGIAVSYNTDSLALFTRAKRLVYDLEKGTVTDENQKSVSTSTAYKNGLLFIPAYFAAKHFGLSLTVLSSAAGNQVLRFTDGTQQLDNDTFIRKAETLISIILKNENEASQTQTPASSDETAANPGGERTVYLAFAGESVNEQTLEMLNTQKLYAVFFLTQRQIAEEQELVRAIFSAGHQIGLTVENGETEYAAALEAANDALDITLCMKSLMVLMPPNGQDMAEYIVFRESGAVQNADSLLQDDNPGPWLLVCKRDAIGTVQALIQAGAHLPQLRETTYIPGVTAQKTT